MFSEADSLLGFDFLENNLCDTLISSMQLKFPNSQTVPLIHSCKSFLDHSTEQVNVIARKTTFFSAGHEALILSELLTQNFPK